METIEQEIPKLTIETIARNFFKEAFEYGFDQLAYLRFVNLLLDIALSTQKKVAVNKGSKTELKEPGPIRMPLIGKRVIIKALEISKYKPIFEKWLTDEYGRNFLLSLPTAKSMTFDELVHKKNNIINVIYLNNNKPIGCIAFLNYDSVQRKAELRKLIGEPEMRGLGLAKEASQLWIKYGIISLGIKKIYLYTLNTNIRNIKLNEELGFNVEGILRNEVFFNGKYHDVLRMGLSTE